MTQTPDPYGSYPPPPQRPVPYPHWDDQPATPPTSAYDYDTYGLRPPDPQQPNYGYVYVPPELRQGSRKTTWIVLGALTLVLAVTAVLVFTLMGTGPKTHPLTIKFGLFDSSGAAGTCSTGGSEGYNDLGPGTPVTVKDETGKIVASTSLPDTGDDSAVGCIWTMHVAVPAEAQQYAVEVGRRGSVTYDHQEVVDRNWTVESSVGGN